MDLLATRYANPFLMLDEFIRLKQLHQFSLEIMKTIADEKANKSRWEYYLHKVYDMTFEDYVNLCEESKAQEQFTTQEMANVVEDSRGILEGFIPE